MPARPDFDVAIAGASIAGCTAARLFGLAGARVALIERRPDPTAYKVICTHQIQSSATPTIERIGLAPLIEAKGAVRSRAAAWSRYGGWLRFPADAPHGYGITRRALDPVLRGLAIETPGVTYLDGRGVVGLIEDGGRIKGVEVEDRRRDRGRISASLTVAADGRDSTLARLAGVRARVRPNNRFVYFAYWRGLPASALARVWFLEPDVAAVFPNEDGLSLIGTVVHRSRLAEFRADPEAAYLLAASSLPDGPRLADAERVSGVLGKLEMPNGMRSPARPGIAFVGDAALAADPLFGVGCGWAFQTSEWLADCATQALLGDGGLDAALRRYRRRFLSRLLPHYLQIADFSSGRQLRANERLAFRAAGRDERVAHAVEAFATRRSRISMLDPRLMPRLLAAGL